VLDICCVEGPFRARTYDIRELAEAAFAVCFFCNTVQQLAYLEQAAIAFQEPLLVLEAEAVHLPDQANIVGDAGRMRIATGS
jgi:hypothetical protein